ncbi:hypothetical protein ABN028_15985 [Actinopolymorpha sp. B17G11]|uniref:hypothetical protein n=1 Tax=Actinopolymorpha sp. B17G11 TaxID=3160861 RepID=UPI0032E4C282
MSLTLGAAAAIGFALALLLMRKKAWPRAVPWLMLIAGLGVAGLLGNLLHRFAGAAERVTGAGTAAVFGVAVPVLLAVVMGAYLFIHLKPKGAPPTRVTAWTALLFPAVLTAVGGAFAGVAAVAEGALGTVGQTVGSLFNDVISGLGA